MVICVVDSKGKVMTTRRIANRFEELEAIIKAYENIELAVESTFNWYWLVDACRAHDIRIHLGHAYYMKAIHGDKQKNDKLDARKIADLLRAGLLPYAHACSAEQRSVRDLLRQRLRLVRMRSTLFIRTRMIFYQAGDIDTAGGALKNKTQRDKTVDRLSDHFTRTVCRTNMSLATTIDEHIRHIEKEVYRHAQEHHCHDLAILQTVPGIGPIIGLTVLYELDTLARFRRRQDFSSYCRLAKPIHSSDNKPVGRGNAKCGSPYLKWAFMEVLSNAATSCESVRVVSDYLKTRHEPLRARAILANHFCTVVYYMLKHKLPFDEERFIASFPEAFSHSPQLERAA
jgi:transposase